MGSTLRLLPGHSPLVVEVCQMQFTALTVCLHSESAAADPGSAVLALDSGGRVVLWLWDWPPGAVRARL